MSEDAAGGAETAPEQEWLGALFTAHADRLYRLARRLTWGADEALDLVHETFLKVAGSVRRPPAGAEEAWLVRILVNIRRDQWRKEVVRRRDAHYLQPTGAVNPERGYVLRLVVWRALDTLAPRRRAVLVMHELEGLSVAAIASLLGIAAITVRWHFATGRREFARRIRTIEGGTDGHAHATLAEGRPAPIRTGAKP